MDIQLQNNNYLDSSCGMEENSGFFDNFVTFKELEQVIHKANWLRTWNLLIGNLLPFTNTLLII